MKHTLICFIFLAALQHGNTGLVNAKHRRAVEGGNITVACNFNWSGKRKLFCKEKCEDGNILVETSAAAAQNGRYSIKYEKKSGFTSYDIMYVSITQVKESDSGRYRCSLERLLLPDASDDFELIVTKASTTAAPNVIQRPFSASGFLSSASKTPPTLSVSSGLRSSTPPSFSKPPPALSVSSGSGSSTPPPASTGSSGLLLCFLILVVMISVLLAALLIFCKTRRPTKPRGPPVETECADREDSRLYEEIRECGSPSRSPPVEVSSVYATVKGPQPDGDESMSIYSLVTSPQDKVEDNSDHLTYSEVDFSHIPATCSAPCSDATDVIYFVPQVGLSAANHTREASPPLYSTVTLV